MSITFQIRDYLGCAKADIEVSTISLLAGKNGAGKSSTIGAVQALLTGLVIPSATMKKNADALVRRGGPTATASIAWAQGRRDISWPSCDVKGTGRAPVATPWAAGVTSLVDIDATARAKLLATYLKADPNKEDVAVVFNEQGLDSAMVDATWDMIQTKGWDGAFEFAKDEGATLKREWEKNAGGERWGVAKAGSWLPEGWSNDFLAKGIAGLDAAIAKADADVEAAVGNAAVDREKTARLKESVAGIGALEKVVAELTEKKAACAKAVSDAEQVYFACKPAPLASEHADCPICKGHLVVKVAGDRKYELIDAGSLPSEKEAMRATQDRFNANKAMVDAQGALSRAGDELRAADRRLDAAQLDKKELAKIALADNAKTAIEGAPTVDQAKEALLNAKGNRATLQRKLDADAKHAAIERIIIVGGALKPDGLRKKKMLEAIEAFNSGQLAELCEWAGWTPVVIDADLNPWFGKTPYHLAAESERFKVRVILQIAFAQLDASDMLVIDGADLLVGDGRNDLFNLLAAVSIPALIGMSFGVAKNVPDLGAADAGLSYWVADGIVAPLSAAVKVAA